MSSRYKVLCGVPAENCSGSKLLTDQHFHTTKCHQTHEEAFKCMAKYLTQVAGFTRVGAREFQDPSDNTIRVLPRKSDFGAHLRTGKEQQRYMPSSKKSGNSGVLFTK